MGVSEWVEIDLHGHRFRYRHDGEEHAHFGAGWELEVWREAHGGNSTKGWRPVRNWSSRDWFVLGLLAGREEVGQVEMQLTGGDG